MSFTTPNWDTAQLIGIPGLSHLVDLFRSADNVAQAEKLLYDARKIISDVLTFEDEAFGAMEALVLALQNMITDLLKSNAHGIALGPRSLMDMLSGINIKDDLVRFNSLPLVNGFDAEEALSGFSVDDLIIQLSDSFGDRADPDRPNYSEDATVGGLVFVFGVDTVTDLLPIYRYLLKMFDGATWAGPWAAALEKLGQFNDAEFEPPQLGESTPPDWGRAVGIVPKAAKTLDKLVGTIEGFNAVGKVSVLHEAVDEVAEAWFGSISEGLDLLEILLADLTEAAEGIGPGVNLHLLYLKPPKPDASKGELGGGVPLFRSRLAASGNRPTDNYCVGMSLVLGSLSFSTVAIQWDALMTVLGLDSLKLLT